MVIYFETFSVPVLELKQPGMINSAMFSSVSPFINAVAGDFRSSISLFSPININICIDQQSALIEKALPHNKYIEEV